MRTRKRVKELSETPQSTATGDFSQGVDETPEVTDKVKTNIDEVQQRRGEPPIWANTRQQITDALEWYRCMQGGASHKEKKCTGFLLDGDSGDRSFMSDEVFITRIGGDCKKERDGSLLLKNDQSPNGTIITSITASFQERKPVGVVIGSNNTLLNVQIPHRYCVMDWFLITDVWTEKMGKYAGYRIRLEKLDLSTKGWWIEQGSDASLPLDHSNKPPPSQKCGECGKSSLQIYSRPGWMCLERSCAKFWKFSNDEPTDFEFHSDFLDYRHPRGADIPNPGPLAEIVDRNIEPSDGTADREEWRGIVCPECRKSIQRVSWDAWDCAKDYSRGPEETCCYKVVRKMREISLESVLNGAKPYLSKQMEGTLEPVIDKDSLKPYEVRTYQLPDIGSITHFVSNASINGRTDGPNAMFSQLQRLDLGLRRYPLESAQVKGTLTCHFAVNYGVPYKYVVSVDSKAFSDAPAEIMTALGRLSWATEQAVTRVGDQYQPPNELLALGYFEKMKIGFHDDGETALGPTIATLSLGSRSRMYIRMKGKYYFGVSHSNTPTPCDPVLSGCVQEEKRQSLKEDFEAGRITKDVYNKRRKAMLYRLDNKQPPKLLTLELKHGDLVVMHGAKLQKYFEHSVEPDKMLRFALTARYIESKDKADLLKGEFKLQDHQIYDGY
ncbi:hypothetical protein F1880_006750 [Penicillium rolfsii]|nr:hypothetical protein F1880_006750 [Penicillium rolfsii]